MVNYFLTFFSSSSTPIDYSDVAEVIPKLVSIEDNDMLIRIPIVSDIKTVVFDMDPHSALGLDGFLGLLFCNCWEVVEHDFCAAVQSFFLIGTLMNGFNSSFMILLPKVPGANSIDKFRPITLSNFIFKVITKIIADRLSLLAPKLVSPSQFGFIKGRHIED